VRVSLKKIAGWVLKRPVCFSMRSAPTGPGGSDRAPRGGCSGRRRTRSKLIGVTAWAWLILLATTAHAQWICVGDYMGHYDLKGNEVTFTCTNAVVKVQVCTEDIVRIRMNPSGEFMPNEPYVVIKYDWASSPFAVTDRGHYVDITTPRLTARVNKSPFRIDIYDRHMEPLCMEPAKGGAGFDGEKVICRKKLTATSHFFGLWQRYEQSDLRGQRRQLWVTEEVTFIPFFMATDGYGIFFHNTWKSTFDFTRDPYYFSAPGGKELDYYFIYGPSFKQILDLYTQITGKAPLPPKWAFGLYYSAWAKVQKGQRGILETVKAARETQDWPLDCIRVHSKNRGQGIWAGPKVNWPDDGWGSFPAVDEMVADLHEANCHAIFWENPGIPADCNDKYAEGVRNEYFIMEDGQVWNGPFAYGMTYGGLIDFCNPAARKWWAQLHNFMIDFGSDGTAGDHGEEVLGKMYSPYSGMSGEELHNLYSMLYDMASWEAYKTRVPNKRCIAFGRSHWAGCQRYPMQGTQDSHAMKKHIHGEMMGMINFGLSGVPFRIFTDNVSCTGGEGAAVRFSQFTSLGVGGERTLVCWTDNKIADDNYRFYAKLRYRLMPYIYTYARQATRTGLPVMRALVLEYQDDPGTYPVYCQYLLGEELLIAPLWSDSAFSRDIYLPKGKWIDFWDGTVYSGGRIISYSAPIDKVPILVKAGAIIPMAPGGQRYVDEKKDPLTIRIYPEGISSFELYEDDGISYDYEKGVYAITTFTCVENEQGVIVKKSTPTGSFTIPERDQIFRLHKAMAVKSVTTDGKVLGRLQTREAFDAAEEGWFHDETDQIIMAKVKGGANKTLCVSFNRDSAVRAGESS